MKKIALFTACFLLAGCGDGALKRMTTIAGVYEVVHPGGYPVVCFVEASHGGVFCLTDKELREGK